MSTRVVCCGEALIDLFGQDHPGLRWHSHPGGSPYNVAIAAGRLGAPTSFVGVLSSDRFGAVLRDRLVESNVDVEHCPTTDEPTTVAVVSEVWGAPDVDFRFYVAGTTTVSARNNDLHLPGAFGIFHVSGSLALVSEPAASRIEGLLAASQRRSLISLDPNPRPRVIDRDRFLARLQRWLRFADLVKVSEADLAWSHPDRDPDDVARGWIHGSDEDDDAETPVVVVVTAGDRGARVIRADGTPVAVPARTVDVVDCVGAGDSFSGALLAALSAHGVDTRDRLAALDPTWWQTALSFASDAAGITSARAGAEPPWRAEL